MLKLRMAEELKLPDPVKLLRDLKEVEEDLILEETPMGAGPLLTKRYKLIYLLVLVHKFGNIRNREIEALIESDAQAKYVLEGLTNDVSTPKAGETYAERAMDFPRSGILSGFNTTNK